MAVIGGLSSQPSPSTLYSPSTYFCLHHSRASTSAMVLPPRSLRASSRALHGFCSQELGKVAFDGSNYHCKSSHIAPPPSGSKVDQVSWGKRKVWLEAHGSLQEGSKVHPGIWGDTLAWSEAHRRLQEDKKKMCGQEDLPPDDNAFKLNSAPTQAQFDRDQSASVGDTHATLSLFQGSKTVGISSDMGSHCFLSETSLSFPENISCNGKSDTSTIAKPLTQWQKRECYSENDSMVDKSVFTSNGTPVGKRASCASQTGVRDKLCQIYESVLVVNNIYAAKQVVRMLTNQYRHLVHACDTEVAQIDVKQETPVDHGEIICFSIFSGPNVDFGNGKSCIWVDVLDGGGRNILLEFAPFFEDSSIKKVWHNYSFDNHIIENYGIKVSGFHADTMHMARLWNSSRQGEGGYSLEALTSDPKIMASSQKNSEHFCVQKYLMGKVSMKTIFGRKKLKKDGSEGKVIVIPPVEQLQREEGKPWICYSALDSISTLKLYESLENLLLKEKWYLDGLLKGNMFEFYEQYWKPFGELLVKMEMEGMLVDRSYLAEIEKLASVEQQIAVNRFRNWASKYCPDAKYMNVGSDAQLRQLFFGGCANWKDYTQMVPHERTFRVPNVDKLIEEGKKSPGKFHSITLHGIVDDLQSEIYTDSGWPSVSGDALKALAGKISAESDYTLDFPSDDSDLETMNDKCMSNTSSYGTAYTAFGEGRKGKDACHAIAALCKIGTIDSLISNFILPLQGHGVSGKAGRIHCSLNINTETGRLSARRPNLQNQPALEKDRYKIRKAFIAAPGNSLVVADYGQLELRILAHLANCKSMLVAFKAGGDFHSRTAMNMYPHIQEAVEKKEVLLEWHRQPGEVRPPVPLLKDAFASERRKAKMLNFSIAYGKTAIGLARDWKVSVEEARETVKLWYKERREVLLWQQKRKTEAIESHSVRTLLGRCRRFPSTANASCSARRHIERAAINTPVQGSAADVAMCAMLEISRNVVLKELGWRLILQIHDEVILEGPTDSAEMARDIVGQCMCRPFDGKNILNVDLTVDARCARDWYSAK